MNSPAFKHWIDLARVTIELDSPVTIGSGTFDDLVDSPFVTDANGLPAIPGTSLAGVLRAAWVDDGQQDLPAAEELFGSVERLDDASTRCRPSRLSISWGHIHDEGNRPIVGLVDRGRLESDAILRQAAAPIARQHVRIDATGTADRGGRGLFDEAVVRAGHRFTFELAVTWSQRRMTPSTQPDKSDAPSDDADYEPIPAYEEALGRILSLMAGEELRLGGKTRRGMGAFRVIGVRRRCFALHEATDFKTFADLHSDLSVEPTEGMLRKEDVKAASNSNTITATLHLEPRGSWLFGGGAPALTKSAEPDADVGTGNEPDILPYREARVSWGEDDRGKFDNSSKLVLITASGLKGALRHRARFHNHVLNGYFADIHMRREDLDPFGRDLSTKSDAVIELFGVVTAEGSDDEASAQPGRVVLDEIHLDSEPPQQVVQHVSLDRFTQGPLDGHLFAEQVNWKLGPAEPQSIVTKVHVRRANDISNKARQVLRRTLDDLVEGRLQIGAGSGRGHGWMSGRIEWSDPSWPDGHGPLEEGTS